MGSEAIDFAGVRRCWQMSGRHKERISRRRPRSFRTAHQRQRVYCTSAPESEAVRLFRAHSVTDDGLHSVTDDRLHSVTEDGPIAQIKQTHRTVPRSIDLDLERFGLGPPGPSRARRSRRCPTPRTTPPPKKSMAEFRGRLESAPWSSDPPLDDEAPTASMHAHKGKDGGKFSGCRRTQKGLHDPRHAAEAA